MSNNVLITWDLVILSSQNISMIQLSIKHLETSLESTHFEALEPKLESLKVKNNDKNNFIHGSLVNCIRIVPYTHKGRTRKSSYEQNHKKRLDRCIARTIVISDKQT